MGLPPLGSDETIYRAIRRSSDLIKETGKAAANAFVRRPSETGLSVDYGVRPDECGRELNKVYGVVALKVGDVLALNERAREIGLSLNLQVVPDSNTHANIVGVPLQHENPLLASWVADRLKELCRRV